MKLSDLASSISVELPGCPTITIERVLRSSLPVLYRQKRLWTLRTTATVSATTGRLAYAGLPDAQVVRLLAVRDENDAPIPVRGPGYVAHQTTDTAIYRDGDEDVMFVPSILVRILRYVFARNAAYSVLAVYATVASTCMVRASEW